ncbi:hypothetical protein PHMEG_00031482 [Phytophthora megakarya]|uniref:Uncharacterized protein n=1 Tax=Phytophthora megakarya TaxID=4795 RepID=A0A225UYQ9_9STRA|nr:hypothetical protein PHMEG_00031482 [Phytophthora megakarya]
MDQTELCIGNPGRLTIDVRGAKNVDVVQGMSENGSRTPLVVHTLQRKAWCNHDTMLKWIEEVRDYITI